MFMGLIMECFIVLPCHYIRVFRFRTQSLVHYNQLHTLFVLDNNLFWTEIRYKLFFRLPLTHFFFWRYSPNLGLGLPPWNFPFHFGLLDLRYSVGLLGPVMSSSQGLPVHRHRKTHIQILNIHALSGIRTHDPGFRASEDSACVRALGYRDRHFLHIFSCI
jgi:hypothetical protein